jgi:hypothetical protein
LDFVHVAINNNSRISFGEFKPDEKSPGAISFLKAAVAYDNGLGVTMTG